MNRTDDIPLYIVIFGVLLLVFLGILYLFAPEEVWEFQHRRTVQGGKPTRFYLITARISGIFFLLCAVALIVLAIIVNNN